MAGVPQPATGSHLRVMAKIRINRTPLANSGMEVVIRLKSEMARSVGRPSFSPATTPSPKATAIDCAGRC